ncbi:PREDICTED: zinc finger BED domain-containing protein 1-like [Cyphomyrmex costatus]|nr:PREDICTED: zinc finger BED domain-containing protein 1-like [Cyphomyrmex costatus]
MDWNIPLSKIHAVVTDNAANIVKAVEIVFGKNKHVACLAHSINLIPAKIFDKLPDLKVLINKIKSIVTYFKHSVLASDELRKNQRASGTSLKLIQEVSTRWSSTYYMIERFMEVIDNVSAVLINQRNSPPMLSAFEVATAQEILKILKPLEMITVEISNEKHPTISKVIPMIYLLRNKINELTPESEIGKQSKKYILQEINVRFNNIENNELYAIATVLDLRFRKIYFESQLSCSNAIHKINKLLQNTKNEQQNINNKTNLHTEVDPTSLWSSHSSLVAKANNLISENGSGCLHSHLKNYLNQDALPLQANPIEYWTSIENACPNLSKIALKYVSTIATSVPSERLFSRTGNIMTDNRNRLKGDRLSRLLFLSSLDIADWHLSD